MISSTSQHLCAQMEELATKLQSFGQEPVQKSIQADYFSILGKISTIVTPLFKRIHEICLDAGLSRAALLVAAPRVRVENFVFLVQDPQTQDFTHVVLAKNKKFGFLQNGGGKTRVGENFVDAAVREAKEEFSFPHHSLTYLTTESEGGMPAFHFGKGVYIGVVSPEEAPDSPPVDDPSYKGLKLADDMKDKDYCKMTIPEFLKITDEDKKPIDHGFDRKWIAKFLREKNITEEFSQRTLSKEDVDAAVKFQEWEKGIKFDETLCTHMEEIVQRFVSELRVDGHMKGSWRDKDNREQITKAAQKIVDIITKKLVSDWTYMDSKKGMQSALQMKVQDGQGFTIDNGVLLPSFMTTPQYMAQKLLKAGALPDTLIGKQVSI